MMKMNFRTHLFIFGILALGSLFLYANADAVNPQKIEEKQARKEERKAEVDATREEKRVEIQARICENISDISSKFNGRINEKGELIRTRKQERENNWEEKLVEVDNQLTTFRNKRDTAWEEHFAKLKEKATTDEQKKAVADFESAVKKAIETRRAAIDVAMVTFRSGIKNLINTRKNGIEGAVENYRISQKAAFEKAKASCSDGADPKTVRTTLHASLKLARDKFNAERQSVEKVGSSMNTLVTSKQSAIDKAVSDFKATMERERAKLKAAFPAE